MINLVSDKNGTLYAQNIYEKYNTLVLSGGALKIIYTLGFLSIINKSILPCINNYVGTSAGGITCFLLSIGYSPIEIFKKLLTYDIIANVFKIFNIYFDMVKKMCISKLGKDDITFEDHYKLTGKVLVIISYNMTKTQSEELSVFTKPHLSIYKALHMTSSLPIINNPIIEENEKYIDGMICDNFPIRFGITYSEGNLLCVTTLRSEYNISEWYGIEGITIIMINDTYDFIPYIVCTKKDKLNMFYKGVTTAITIPIPSINIRKRRNSI
ncbi:hypothetical protein AGMMS49579_03930 [Spirochaetia bacterium]|nr:hypothetical protein AGMMS49579_03930 [Spirochaetia bacterium]